MKTIGILIFIFNLIYIRTVESQVTWFPVGAKWYYDYSAFIGGGLTTLEVLNEDTLIGSHVYKKILSTTIVSYYPESRDTFFEVLYVFEENRVVIGYDQYWSFPFLLFDFNASIGDTLGMLCPGLSYGPFIVDSIGQMEFNGSFLAFQDIEFPSLLEPGEFDRLRVMEGIGSNFHLFHDHIIVQPFDAPFYYLRCYEDENLGLVSFIDDTLYCDYIDGTTSVDEEIEVSTTIFPNPADNYIIVRTENLSLEKVMVVDIVGSTRIIQASTPRELLKINISQLENGFYFTLGKDKNGEIVFVKKFTKYGK